MEPAGQERRQVQRNIGMSFEKSEGVVHHIGTRDRQGLHRGAVRHIQQHRDFSKDRAGLIDMGHARVAANNFDLALYQDDKLAAPLTFLK
jgi:hypothetical protein